MSCCESLLAGPSATMPGGISFFCRPKNHYNAGAILWNTVGEDVSVFRTGGRCFTILMLGNIRLPRTVGEIGRTKMARSSLDSVKSFPWPWAGKTVHRWKCSSRTKKLRLISNVLMQELFLGRGAVSTSGHVFAETGTESMHLQP